MEVETVHTHDECVICDMLISSARQIDRPGTEICGRCAAFLDAEAAEWRRRGLAERGEL